MTRKELEQEEKYYEQYNRDSTHPRDREETRAFRLYAQIRHQMRNAKVPKYDRSSLVNRMVMKMEGRPKRFLLFPGGVSISRLVIATAYAAIFAVSLGICSHTLLSIDWNLTQNIHFISETNREFAVPALWKYRLWSGKKVIVPPGIRAVMCLSDGSKLECRNETQIAVQFGHDRKIDLKSGKITIHASPNNEKPMRVTTPLGEVQVVGTVFSVELTR